MITIEIWDIYDESENKTGRTIERGKKLQDGDYHLVVHIWFVNDSEEFLIQKRAEHLKLFPGVWATTGGSALAGENSKTAAIRETKEELGIEPDINNMKKIKRIQRKDNFTDIWLVKQNISLNEINIQEEEVSEVRWVDKKSIIEMTNDGKFHNYGKDYFKYIL